MARGSYIAFFALILAVLCAGCATVNLDSARREFYEGRLAEADKTLAAIPDNSDKILTLMERGMIRHILQDYTNSTADWLEAVRLEKAYETHSVSKAGASMLVNDRMLDFRGYPYERIYLHAFLARNYLAQGLWDDAGVEARAIALKLEKLEGYPDDPYAHYLAGFCLELCGDDSNATMQYRQVARLAPDSNIDEKTGRFKIPGGPTNAPIIPFFGHELVCFLDFDGSLGLIPESAEIYVQGKMLGKSHTLANVIALETASRKQNEFKKTAKTVSRLVFKGSLAVAASSKNNDLGNLLWLLLLATEAGDLRRWETLPGKMAVVRVPCPDDLKEFDVQFKGYGGSPIKTMHVTRPLARRGKIYVSMCRDNP